MSETDETILHQSSGCIRVLLADDHPVTRAGIRAILEEASNIEVVGEAKDGVEAQQLVAELGPDILLLDLVMPGPRPSEVEKWVRTNYPETITLVLTAHDRDCYLAKMIEAGAAGFLTKEEAPQRLVEAIRCAARGDVLITGGQLARANHWREEVGARWESLTERERQVLQLLAEGLDNAAIAEALRVSVNTVRCHISHIYSKLGVADRAEAIVFVLRHKLIEI
ncbi:MAG: response regulator transcription factor [Chloroflexota bacterium]|nr:response regulator transcription factor [Chloroflexota bacterium]